MFYTLCIIIQKKFLYSIFFFFFRSERIIVSKLLVSYVRDIMLGMLYNVIKYYIPHNLILIYIIHIYNIMKCFPLDYRSISIIIRKFVYYFVVTCTFQYFLYNRFLLILLLLLSGYNNIFFIRNFSLFSDGVKHLKKIKC